MVKAELIWRGNSCALSFVRYFKEHESLRSPTNFLEKSMEIFSSYFSTKARRGPKSELTVFLSFAFASILDSFRTALTDFAGNTMK